MYKILIILINNILIVSSLNTLINAPFDRAANIIGSRYAPKVLSNDLKNLNFNKNHIIPDNNEFLDLYYQNLYKQFFKSLNNNENPLLIGGDHSLAISSIFAANKYCLNNNLTLGVLWCDAYADFNTIYTSPTGNIHGIPVSILCGHTLNHLVLDDILKPNQFLYYGLRDIDSLELFRLQEYNMKIAYNIEEIESWFNKFDKIHLSFDMDCLDPKYFKSVNTPVNDGIDIIDIKLLFANLKNSDKLLSMDLVEYNPNLGNQNNVIIDLLKCIV